MPDNGEDHRRLLCIREPRPQGGPRLFEFVHEALESGIAPERVSRSSAGWLPLPHSTKGS
jgi:hypothetical protein